MKFRSLLPIAATAAALAVMSPAVATAADEATYETVAVIWPAAQEPLGNIGEVPDAWGSLTRRDDGVSFQLHTNSLTPGNAYTLWFITIQNPSACAVPECTPQDVTGNPETNSQVTGVGGMVAGDAAGTFAGEVSTGPLAGWLPDRSFDNPHTAWVHMIVHDHGPVVPELMPGMISTFRGGCTDETLPPVPDSAFNDGEPGPNECTFFHAALFEDV